MSTFEIGKANKMAKFKHQYCEDLLRAHQPNQLAYMCNEIGVEPNADTLADIDAAYAELESLGYVVKCVEQTTNIYSGGTPKHPFKITEAALQTKE